MATHSINGSACTTKKLAEQLLKAFILEAREDDDRFAVAIFGPGKKEELNDEKIQQLAMKPRKDLIDIISRCGIAEARLKDVDHGQLHDVMNK